MSAPIFVRFQVIILIYPNLISDLYILLIKLNIEIFKFKYLDVSMMNLDNDMGIFKFEYRDIYFKFEYKNNAV